MTVVKLNKKRKFNVSNKTDVEIYKSFLKLRSWKGYGSCPFQLENPYLSVPDMINDKLIRKLLKLIA